MVAGRGHTAEHKSVLGAKGAIELILTAMHNHVGRATLQKNACAALWDLTFLKRAWPPTMALALARQPQSSLTLTTLRCLAIQARTSCASPPAVASSACWTRCATTRTTMRCSRRPWACCSTSQSCVRAVTACTLPTLPSSAQLMRHSLAVLAWLRVSVLACAAENKTTIRKCDGIALMMRAMTEHPNDALVQRNSCWAMWNLAAQSPEDRQAIASAGAIPVVLRAMALHPREAAVHQKATGVLDNLAVEGAFACAACRVPGPPHVASRRFLTCGCCLRLLSAQPRRDH